MNDDAAELFGGSFETISRYVDILRSRGIDWGLIGPREADRLWERHILNSVAIAPLLSEGSAVADIGSGAGLPGVPLAILRPDLRMDLVEPLLRRSSFLSEVVSELGLADRVHVVRARAEEVDDSYDTVTSRALAPLPRLLTWCVPLLRPDGQIVAIKGRSAGQELLEAQAHVDRRGLVADVLTVRATPSSDPTAVVRVARR